MSRGRSRGRNLEFSKGVKISGEETVASRILETQQGVGAFQALGLGIEIVAHVPSRTSFNDLLGFVESRHGKAPTTIGVMRFFSQQVQPGLKR